MPTLAPNGGFVIRLYGFAVILIEPVMLGW